MLDIDQILEDAVPGLMDSQYVAAVARHNGVIHWLLSDHDNLVLDWKKWREDFIAAGYQVRGESVVASEARGGMVVVGQNEAERFLAVPVTHRLDIKFLRDALLERFSSVQSWWDVGFLFPIAFIDFDSKRLAGFYHEGPRLERYVPDGWVGESVDFATTYSESLFPEKEKFWMVDGRDLLFELNERGRNLEQEK